MKVPIATIFAALILSACGPNPALVKFDREQAERNARFSEASRVSEQRLDCMRNRRADLQIGMSQKQVMATCWNFVNSVNRTTTAAHEREQWIYEVYGRRVYVYFVDYEVSAVQD